MTMLPFVKMHGAGNDFVMLDGRAWPAHALPPARIAALCDRRRGIGGDGLIVLRPAAPGSVSMAYHNADGNEAAMCGNGARCAAAFARRLGLAAGHCTLLTPSGPVLATIMSTASDPTGNEPVEVRVALPRPRDVRLHAKMDGPSPFPDHHFVNTGVPHLVVPVPDVDAVDVARWGPALRGDRAFAPDGTNIDWVAVAKAPGAPPALRTYERGVEGETLACGTGAAAVALVLCRLGLVHSPVALRTRGGDVLTIIVKEAADGPQLELQGPAAVAYEGQVFADV